MFDRKTFLETLDRCYLDPLTVDRIFLCHLNLVFAIGLSFATPEPGTREAEIVDSLRAIKPDLAETFFLNAKSINNPIIGFEDADLWSVQALLLMGLYMLLKSRRNPAFAYIGIAPLIAAAHVQCCSLLTVERHGGAHSLYSWLTSR